MLCQHFRMLVGLEPLELQNVAQQLLSELGDMKVNAWPDLDEWLDEYSADIPAKENNSQIESFQLSDKELKRMVDPSLDTIYSIQNPLLFSKFFMASQRHSELSSIFIPYEVTRSELVRLVHLGDGISYPQRKKNLW